MPAGQKDRAYGQTHRQAGRQAGRAEGQAQCTGHIENSLTCNKEADEGEHGLASCRGHGAGGLVHLGGQNDSSNDLAHSHLNSSLNQEGFTS